MDTSEQPFKPLPIDDDTVFKLLEETKVSLSNISSVDIFDPKLNLFSSTKDFTDKLAKSLFNKLYPQEIFTQGIKAKVLEPEKKWVTGAIRLRVVIEFIPDEPENSGTLNRVTSSLDDFRSKNL